MVEPCASRAAISGSPLETASSTTAVPSGSASQCARTGRPSGPVTKPASRTLAPGVAAAIAAMVPSPPSACGSSTSSSPGRPERQPSAIAAAASAASSVPLNESGATTIRDTASD